MRGLSPVIFVSNEVLKKDGVNDLEIATTKNIDSLRTNSEAKGFDLSGHSCPRSRFCRKEQILKVLVGRHRLRA